MTPDEIKDAVWSARLFASGKSTDLTAKSIKAICDALLVLDSVPLMFVGAPGSAEARLQRAIDLDHEKALEIRNATMRREPGAPFPSSPLQAIQVCPCGLPLPHAAPCPKSTDPEGT